MKHNHHNTFSENQAQQPVVTARQPATDETKRIEADFAPPADEVARRAYFTYENEGAPQGRDVQHWLAAEAELIAERNRTRLHGFHNKS